METRELHKALDKLRHCIEEQEFQGYDPYDTLNSPVPFHWLGKWGQVVAIQIQKRNPINIRPLLGIKKGYNPKGMGLLLEAYSLLYEQNPLPEYREKMDFLFNWLVENGSPGYSGLCWGYNFNWTSPAKTLKAFHPSIVVTGFVGKGVFQYYQTTQDPRAEDVLKSIAKYILNDIPLTQNEHGICFSYSDVKKDCCYNASMLGAEILAKVYSITDDSQLLDYSKKAVDFTVSCQKNSGRWNYSIDLETGEEREQIDFHQGFILDSLAEFLKSTGMSEEKYRNAFSRGLEFYRTEQFFENGRAKWRLPKLYPADIHHQAQGIITFAKQDESDSQSVEFARTIADWTLKNMQSRNGYFYYQKHRFYTNKIPYIRWAQAWMFLALAHLLKRTQQNHR